MYLRDEMSEITKLLKNLIGVIVSKAEAHKGAVMPGYTHLQRAQPVTFAHHILAYAMMFRRDVTRIADATSRMNVNPLGSCALAGTTYNTDRNLTTKLLGFDSYTLNSIDGVSDRDFCLELMSAASIEMTHLSRLAEELVLWSSWEFRFVRIGDAYTTGSSIMPQKKNPDMAELVRGKTGRVFGDMMTLFTVLKGLPLAYNKDMQEDKEAVFDAADTAKLCLRVFIPMIRGMKVLGDNMMNAAKEGFINATDLADYLVGKGLPFRTAYKISGSIVADCIKEKKTLEQLELPEYREYCDLIGEDVYGAIDIVNCVERRTSEGGTSAASIEKQIALVKELL
jgi:argininosuccinate lyase